MDGGAIIGQGHYGCIFDPPLLCQDALAKLKARRERVVGKLSQSEDVENEIYASKVLSDIPKASEYYILPNLNSLCLNPVKMNKQPDQDGIKQCDPIKEFGTSEMVHYTMPFGGISIHNHFEANPTKSMPIRMMVTHLLEACALLTLNGFVHYDLHMGNVLLDSNNVPRLIDFGFSFSSQLLTNEVIGERWKVYSPTYSAEPPEITVATGINKDIPFERVVKEVLKGKQPLKSAEKYFGLSRNAQVRDFVAFWKSSKAVKEKNPLAFFRMYWPAFDAWGAGIIILHLYTKALYMKDLQKQSDWHVISSRLKEILRGLLRMDPRKRLDCVEALAIFSPPSSVVSSPSGKAWLQQKDLMRSELKTS